MDRFAWEVGESANGRTIRQGRGDVDRRKKSYRVIRRERKTGDKR